MFRQPARFGHVRRSIGFTLIELLTVIAIIAILAAIIFPIFASVRENGRQSTSLSNLHDISTKLAQYQLDNHRYPEVLYGYVYCQEDQHVYTKRVYHPVPMDTALAVAETNYAAALAGTDPAAKAEMDPKNWFPGLYPEYIKDPHEFMDSNNSVDDLTAITQKSDPEPIFSADADTFDANVNVLCPSPDRACSGAATGVLKSAKHTWDFVNTGTGTTQRLPLPYAFYADDAYDSSPQVLGPNEIAQDPPVYVPRYQYAWTGINDVALNCDSTSPSPAIAISEDLCGVGVNKYLNQIHWKIPPPRTYVTCTTYHLPAAGKILMLNEAGNVRKAGYEEFVGGLGGADAGAPNWITPDSNDVSHAKFWKLEP